jgi:hypothetical protein
VTAVDDPVTAVDQDQAARRARVSPSRPRRRPPGLAVPARLPDGGALALLLELSSLLEPAPPDSVPPDSVPPDLGASSLAGMADTVGHGRSLRRGGRRRLRVTLPVVLALQAALSARLITANTAFQDEALYLWAGRAELSHWMTGALLPPYPVYFSGAPVLYPPLGAAVASIGGLAAARCLSLAFMLAATVMLHGVTRRIFDRRSALFAAALFAGTGSAQFLGAFATYDAMALCLLTAAMWLGVLATGSSPRSRLALLAAAGLVLALANATKYASALFDPTVLATVMLQAWRGGGRKAGLRAAAVPAAAAAAALGAAIHLGGQSYWHGITGTTLTRAAGPAAPAGILYLSGEWIGIIVVLAIIGAVTVTVTSRSRAAAVMAWLLAATSLLAPLQQARIHTLTSLFKHVGYGAMFASIVAGFALAALPLVVPRAKALRAARLAATVPILAGLLGCALSSAHYDGWPDTTRVTAALGRLLRPHARYLAEDDDILAYYLQGRVPWVQWTSTWFFRYTQPSTGKVLFGMPAYAAAIRAGYFTIIVLSFGDTLSTDKAIEHDISRDGDYTLRSSLPYTTSSLSGEYRIWVRRRQGAR